MTTIDPAVETGLHHSTHFIGGAFVDAASDERIEVIDATTEEVIGSIPAGTAEEVDLAVKAARRAFPSWSRTDPAYRGALLKRVSEGVLARTEELATIQSREVGTPIALSRGMHVGLPANTIAAQNDFVEHAFAEETVGNATVVKEAVGVVGLIAPWNFPLQQVVAKVAPALAAGCTVVLKPSELAPLTTYALLEIFQEAGLPDGVLNVVFGDGQTVGEAIVTHPDIDMVSFTGSTAVGKRIMALAADQVKRVTLELGGKSPLVMLPDGDVSILARRAAGTLALNSGQACSALTRIVAPQSRLKEIEDAIVAAVDDLVVGDPMADGTTVGPLVSARQRDRVRGYIESGIDEGARVVVGGADAPEGLESGYFVRPTVFSDVTTSMRIAQEEIFGPVLAIQPYDDSLGDEEAIRIANDTQYGLAGGVIGADRDRARTVAQAIRAGQVEINGGAFNPIAPFGGYKQSGQGRELGRQSIEEYLEIKALLN
jgi:acyl-CoA reductase-like NAD-dependent aldehyde dehydrogenase